MGFWESISSDSLSAQNSLPDPKTNLQSPRIDPQIPKSDFLRRKSTPKNLNRTPRGKKQTSEAQNQSKLTYRGQYQSKSLKSTPKVQNLFPEV